LSALTEGHIRSTRRTPHVMHVKLLQVCQIEICRSLATLIYHIGDKPFLWSKAKFSVQSSPAIL